MKTKNILWAALSMTAALVMTACSNDDNMTQAPETPNTPEAPTAVTIPYTVTVNDGGTTRATVDSDNKTLRFATGDKLYITGTNVKGVLEIQTGVGETSGATFSGELSYSGSGTPADDLSLTATLMSAQQSVGNEVSVDAAGAVTVNYPTTAYCTDVNDAVEKYSNLTGISTYSAKSFTLTQQTAFLNFVVTFEDGTTTGTELSAVVSNSGSAIATASVTTTTEDTKIVAKFVLPVASNTTLSSAAVKMSEKYAIPFGASQILAGKVYNVKRTQSQYQPLSAATTSDYGKVACAAGHLHTAKTAVPTGCTAVGILGKVTETGHGLILALQDAKNQTWETINGWASETTYAGTTLKLLPDDTARSSLTSYSTLGSTAVSNWAVAQKSDYEAIFINLGSTTGGSDGMTPDASVNAYIIYSVGGTKISDTHWSATVMDDNFAWFFNNFQWNGINRVHSRNVRPVLGF